MIKTVKVTNHLGESLTLELKRPDNSGLFIRKIEGLGPSKTDINLTEGAGIDGAFYNSSRLNVRNLVFDIGFYNWGADSIETIRQRTYRYFPMKRQISLLVETDNRSGMITGYVETNEPDIFSQNSGTQISILCPDPRFYDGDLIETFFSGSVPAFEFPFENPSLTLPLIEMSNLVVETTKTILYTGDEPIGFTMYLDFVGAVNDPVVYNLITNQLFSLVSSRITSLTGSNIVSGDKITISTIQGSKSVYLERAGVRYNILNAVGSSSSWFQLQPGDNVLTYSAQAGSSYIHFRTEHRVAYGGI